VEYSIFHHRPFLISFYNFNHERFINDLLYIGDHIRLQPKETINTSQFDISIRIYFLGFFVVFCFWKTFFGTPKLLKSLKLNQSNTHRMT